MPNPWLQDADVTLYHGDVLAVLRELPAESVDCCVTSPPYWGLRDYGTGMWTGGDEACDHMDTAFDATPQNREGRETPGGRGGTFPTTERQFAQTCGKCGATRIDQQLGLEPTPEEYVTRMVEVFREVRRVLAAHGTVWLNLGDSYASQGDTRSGFNERYFGSGNLGKQAATAAEVPPNTIPTGLKQKDLVGVPWRVAFALQADGWYLRSDIIWAKPNPMPESVTDRPTKAHEYVFLLSKQPRYYFDAEAVREPNTEKSLRDYMSRGQIAKSSGNGETSCGHGGAARVGLIANGRNVRSVWEIATQPYPEAHFATFPEELARRCIAAGCPDQVLVGRRRFLNADGSYRYHADDDVYRAGTVLDPFIGSGTVAHVARKLGRHAVGIDLNESYLELAARRLQQQSLFA